jgi:hypothetical protein
VSESPHTFGNDAIDCRRACFTLTRWSGYMDQVISSSNHSLYQIIGPNRAVIVIRVCNGLRQDLGGTNHFFSEIILENEIRDSPFS